MQDVSDTEGSAKGSSEGDKDTSQEVSDCLSPSGGTGPFGLTLTKMQDVSDTEGSAKGSSEGDKDASQEVSGCLSPSGTGSFVPICRRVCRAHMSMGVCKDLL